MKKLVKLMLVLFVAGMFGFGCEKKTATPPVAPESAPEAPAAEPNAAK